MADIHAAYRQFCKELASQLGCDPADLKTRRVRNSAEFQRASVFVLKNRMDEDCRTHIIRYVVDSKNAGVSIFHEHRRPELTQLWHDVQLELDIEFDGSGGA